MRELTGRQATCLRYIIDCVNSWGYPPTLREIGKHMGIRSTNGVNDHLTYIELKGYIRRADDGESRGITVLRDEYGRRVKTLVVTHREISLLAEERA